ncbi:hypothetical protein Tco_0959996 [Tanacetum coccineum]
MSFPNHPTSNIEDAYSFNFLNYLSASSDYFPASSGKTYSSSSNLFGVIPLASTTLSLFHDDPYMKELLSPKKRGRSSSSTSAIPQNFEIGESSHKTSVERHEEQIKESLTLELPEELSNVHNTFHVSNLKKCLSDESLIIPMKELRLDDKLNFVKEPVEFMDREVKKLKQSHIPIVKVRWNSKRGPEFTWECEDQIRAKYPHLHAKGRKSDVRLSSSHFIGRLAHHFGLVSDDGLRGLSVVTCEVPLIDMGDLGKLNICMEIGDDWAWPPPPPAAGKTMPQRLGRLEEIQGLHRDVKSLRGLVESSMTDQGRVSTWMISRMTQLMEASGIKPGSKFSTIVLEYVTEPSRLSKSRAELRRDSVYQSVRS